MKKRISLILSLILCAAVLAGCGAGRAPVPAATPADRLPESSAHPASPSPAQEDAEAVENAPQEYALSLGRPAAPSVGHDRVFYEIFVGSFSDSDGDGTGDLRGVIQRMDYLNDGDADSGLSLGVEGIWLSPIFLSPSYHKYDVSDYYTIDPAFGTLDDLRELCRLCRERDVLLILDLPLNHTGSENEWFAAFCEAHRSGNTESPWYSFYSWCPQGEGAASGRTFRPIPGCSDLYECNFSDQMPELDLSSSAVREELVKLGRFYLDLGVDGFRFDAIKYASYGDNPASVEFWTWYMAALREVRPDLYAVGECWDADMITELYYPAMNCFCFTVSGATGYLAEAAGGGDVSRYTEYVERYASRILSIRPDASYVPFISNHDMDRAAGMLPLSSGKMHMAANLYLLGPGSPFLYYGEELGMRGSRGSSNTDSNRRLAMAWGDGDTVRDPEGADYAADKRVPAAAAAQLTDAESLYNYYKKLIMIRRANPEIARGAYRSLDFGDSPLGGFLSTAESGTVCVIHNTGKEDAEIDLTCFDGLVSPQLAAFAGFGEASLEGTTLYLGAQTSAVLRVG